MPQIKDIKGIEGHETRKSAYALTQNRPSLLFRLSRTGNFSADRTYAYRRDSLFLGEEALEVAREDVNAVLIAFGYSGKGAVVKRREYVLECNATTIHSLRDIVKQNPWLLPA